MTSPLRAYWWSPRRSARTLVSEVRHHAAAWARLTKVGDLLTNFGDELNAPLLEALTGRPVVWTPLRDAEVVAVGSILAPYLQSNSHALVWGSGIHDPGAAALSGLDRSLVLAVRGPRTREALQLSDAVPVGDPGLLAGSLLGHARARGKMPILIPHLTVFGSRLNVSRLRAIRAAGVRIVPPTLPPLEMLATIAEASQVFSSGMHGLILAHSVGRGATLVRFNEQLSVPFKYGDYYASVGVDSPRVVVWRSLLDQVARDRAQDLAEAEMHAISARVDAIKSSLADAAQSLR